MRQLRAILRCSHCGGPLQADLQALECPACAIRYPRNSFGAPDLRLQRAKSCTVEFEAGPGHLDRLYPAIDFKPLQLNESPVVDFARTPVPHHMTRELMSYFPKAPGPGSLMLDLGCGNAVHKEIGEIAGFEWVGVDQNPYCRATVIADGHALPFEDQTFEFALTVAALHLMRHPHVVLKELKRVLHPGATLVGTVAFLEPFHDGGYYHHTHLGVLNSLDNAGFRVQRLAPSEDWNALRALAQMALFPKMPRALGNAIVWPVQSLHRLWWRSGRAITHNPNAGEDVRIRNTTAAFAFVATA